MNQALALKSPCQAVTLWETKIGRYGIPCRGLSAHMMAHMSISVMFSHRQKSKTLSVTSTR